MLTICILYMSIADLLVHPSLEGRPILIVANRADECESIPNDDLARTIKNWFAEKLAHMDEDPEATTLGSEQHTRKPGSNIFADDDDDLDAYRPPAGAGSTLNDTEYEWDVRLTSAIDG